MYRIIQYCKEGCPNNKTEQCMEYILTRAGHGQIFINGLRFPSRCEECGRFVQYEIRFEGEENGHS